MNSHAIIASTQRSIEDIDRKTKRSSRQSQAKTKYLSDFES